MYLAFVRRKAIEDQRERKIAMIAALHANPNLDGKEGNEAREQMVEKLESNFQDSIDRLYSAEDVEDVEDEIDMNDPFFAAMVLPTMPGEELEQKE